MRTLVPGAECHLAAAPARDVQYLDKKYISVYLDTEILSPYVLGTDEAYLNYRWVDEQTIEHVLTDHDFLLRKCCTCC